MVIYFALIVSVTISPVHTIPITFLNCKVLNELMLGTASATQRVGAVGLSVRPASGRLGVRIPAATDLSRKNSLWHA